MLSDILTIGDKIEMRPLDKAGKPIGLTRAFVSQLIDFVDFDTVYIAAPIVHSRAVLLSVGENLNLCFYSDKGLYQCNCVVLGNHKENHTIVSVVRITTNLEKVQRRQYYRLECIHDIEYRTITPEEQILDRKLRMEDFKNQEERAECRKKLAQFEKEWISGMIIDISGGGARFNSPSLLNHGDKIRIKLDIVIAGNLKKMLLSATVIASGALMNRTGVYEHRVEFIDIMQKDREDLIKYIFEQERKRRRNEKI